MANGIQAGDAVWTISGDLTPLEQSLKQGESEVNKSTGNITQSFSTIGKGMTALGAAITAPLALGVSAATDFGSAMAAVATLGVEDIGSLEEAVRNVAVTYGQDLTGAAEGAYQAISAGVSAAEAPRVLEEAAKAAAAGQSDLTTAIELGTSMTNAFGLEMSNVSGVFDSAFIAVKAGVTTFEELASSAGKTAPAFAAAGLSVDELYGSVAALTKGGLGTAESFTSLNAVIASFTRQGEVSKLETLGLEGALQWLKETTNGNQTEMLKFLGSTEAMTAVLSLTGGQAQSFNDIMGQMSEKTGAAGEAFNIIAESDPAFAWAQLKASMQDLAIEVGQSLLPALHSLLEIVTPMIQGITSWIKENDSLAAGIAVVAGAFGALMIAVGPILMMIPGLVALVQAAIVVFGVVAGVLSGPVILAIAAVVAAGALLYAFWDEITGVIGGAIEGLVAVFEMFAETASAIWTGFVDGVIGIVTGLWDGIASVWDMGMGFLQGLWDGFINMLSMGVDAVVGLIEALAAPFIWLAETIKEALALAGINVSSPNTQPPSPHAEGGQLDEGMNIVGERGPEAIIKHGSEMRVITAENTAAMGGGVTINMNANIASDMDIQRVAQRLGKMLEQRMTGVGASPAMTRI